MISCNICVYSLYAYFLLYMFESEKIRFQIQIQIQKKHFFILENVNGGGQITKNRHG